jgi:ubiquinone/menaquinone biosynthesis C-methylase UbiE
MTDKKENKDFYTLHPDKIISKRFNSPYKLRRYAHECQYDSIVSFVEPGMRVLDAGCGEGVLSIMMAEKGAIVTGCDISVPNIDASKKYAHEKNISNVTFLVSDIENMPFDDNSFDLVVSSHVLEHIPDFDKGLREIMRITKKAAVVAIPTIINPCSWVQVGRGWFYLKGPKSFLAFFVGFCKMVFAFISREEGVDETYSQGHMPHVFRFPWIMKNKIKENGFKLISYEASTLCFPYFEFLLPFIKFLDKFKNKKILRNFGYGTTFIIEK